MPAQRGIVASRSRQCSTSSRDDVSQNQFFNNIPIKGTPALPNSCPASTNGSFYNCPFGLGVVNKTIGSPRQIQMSLSLQF
jgi:hypothetical protein